MITTPAPPWLRRSDQAVTWARTMLTPHRAVVIDCETTDLPGALSGKVGYSNLWNKPETRSRRRSRGVVKEDPRAAVRPRRPVKHNCLMQESCIRREADWDVLAPVTGPRRACRTRTSCTSCACAR
jgi:hypothetical protein